MSSNTYSYNVDERSLTQDTLLKWCWRPMQARIPASVTPNTITLLGFLSLCASCFFAYCAMEFNSPLLYLATAACLFGYMACDNIDGLHARATQQSSALGEFLDHYFDSISFVLINFFVIKALNLSGWILAAYLVALSMAFFSTIWAHKHTGTFYSGPMGTNEALLLMMLLFAVLAFLSNHPMIQYKAGTINLATVMAGASIFVSVITVGEAIRRVPREHLFEFLPLGVILYCTSELGYKEALSLDMSILLSLGCCTFLCARLHVEHLTDRVSKIRWVWDDIVSIGFIVMVFDYQMLQGHHHKVIAMGLLGVMAVTVINDGIRALRFVQQTAS